MAGFTKKTKEERAAEVKALIGRIEEGIKAVTSGEDWANLLRARANFHRYSFSNQMLIALQRPGATYVAGFDTWKNKLGRMVRKGEKGIRILAPIPWSRAEAVEGGGEEIRKGIWFKSVAVFDYSQTDAIPGRKAFVPPQLAAPGDVKGDEAAAAEIFVQLATHAQQGLKVPVTVEGIGRTGVDGYYSLDTKRIVIGEHLSPLRRVAVLAHELAHATLHAGIADYHAHRGRYEVEAESVAFMVCHAAGLDASGFSFPYVASWAAKGGDVRESMERIGEGVKRILAGVGAEEEEAAESAAA